MNLRRFFSRRRSPTSPEDWQAGDLAECIVGSVGWRNSHAEQVTGPCHGQLLKVFRIGVFYDPRPRRGKVLCLGFAGWPNDFAQLLSDAADSFFESEDE